MEMFIYLRVEAVVKVAYKKQNQRRIKALLKVVWRRVVTTRLLERRLYLIKKAYKK
jgi:hypothetical protein